jgi:hypothetical protein
LLWDGHSAVAAPRRKSDIILVHRMRENKDPWQRPIRFPPS